MTRPSKKGHERRLVLVFLDGLVAYTSLVDGEKPDFRIRRAEGDIALEVTEYHPKAPIGSTGKPRIAVEASWWRDLEPFINRERQNKALKHVQAYLDFKDGHLPRNAQGAEVARELVDAVAAAAAYLQPPGEYSTVDFVPRTQIASFGAHPDAETVFLPLEDWPDIASRLKSLSVCRYSLEWPAWSCLNATTAWLAPDVAEFKRILEDKAEASKDYALGGLPLWLLIICDAVDDGRESHGDLASHIFPCSEASKEQMSDVLRQTGFDLKTGPFSQVWLFSCFTRNRHRLHGPR
jgi:hypothetical protein